MREELTNELVTNLGDEVLKLQDVLKNEKRSREESQKNLYKMLEDLDEKLTSDLTIERKTRENTEETLLRLLEETCMRIETSAFNWIYTIWFK